MRHPMYMFWSVGQRARQGERERVCVCVCVVCKRVCVYVL